MKPGVDGSKRRNLFEIPVFFTVVTLITLLSVLALNLDGFFGDPGTGWHLKTGELISQSGEIPKVDPFLGGGKERKWVYDQWLGGLLMFYGVKAFSNSGILVIFLSIYFLTFFGTLHSCAVRNSENSIASTIAALFACKVACIQLLLRPLVFGYAIFAWCLALAYQMNAELLDRKFLLGLSKRLFILFPLIFLIWANIHSSFVLGFGLILSVLVGHFIDSVLINRDRPNIKGLLAGSSILVLSFFATLINPYGYDLYRKSIYSLAGSNYFLSLNQEWHKLDFSDAVGFYFIVMVLITVVGVIVNKKNTRLPAFEFISCIVFAILGARMIRLLPYASMILVPVFAKSIDGVGVIFRRIGFKALSKAYGNIDSREKVGKYPVLILILLGFGAIVFSSGAIPLAKVKLGVENQSKYPKKIMEFLVSSGRTVTVLNDPNLGGYIEYTGYPTVKPLLDDRNQLLGEKAYRDYLERLLPDGDYEAYIREQSPDFILISDHHKLASHIISSSFLKIVRRDANYTLFEVN